MTRSSLLFALLSALLFLSLPGGGRGRFSSSPLPPAVVSALTVCITGTNSGIGRSAATRLVREGHTVYHACRTAARAAEAAAAAGGGVPMVCDLSDLTSVRSFAADLTERVGGGGGGGLDVLCLNAGVSPSRKAPAPRVTADGLEETVAVNHLGHFLLAGLVQPLLLLGSSGSTGRIIVTASSVHDPSSAGGTVQGDASTGATLGDLSGLGVPIPEDGASSSASAVPVMVDGSTVYNGAKAYHDSKLCNVLFAREAHRRWNGANGGSTSSISVRAFNPGLITATGLFRSAREDSPISTALFSFVASRVAGFSVPVDVGGDRLAYLVTAPEEEVPSGSYLAAASATSRATTRSEGFEEAQVSDEARDDDLAARLWERSADVVGLAY